jgi:DNA-binding XRE family transcriptional regulator
MLRTEQEYKAAKAQLSKLTELLEKQREKFKAKGYKAKEVENLMAPTITYARQTAEEIEFYEQLLAGKVPAVSSFSSAGQLLVAARIAKKWTQRDLAQALGVSEAVVSRDERNEYHAVTIEKAQRVAEALGAEVRVELLLTKKEPISA